MTVWRDDLMDSHKGCLGSSCRTHDEADSKLSIKDNSHHRLYTVFLPRDHSLRLHCILQGLYVGAGSEG